MKQHNSIKYFTEFHTTKEKKRKQEHPRKNDMFMCIVADMCVISLGLYIADIIGVCPTFKINLCVISLEQLWMSYYQWLNNLQINSIIEIWLWSPLLIWIMRSYQLMPWKHFGKVGYKRMLINVQAPIRICSCILINSTWSSKT